MKAVIFFILIISLAFSLRGLNRFQKLESDSGEQTVEDLSEISLVDVKNSKNSPSGLIKLIRCYSIF